jgi:hypothetical protein
MGNELAKWLLFKTLETEKPPEYDRHHGHLRKDDVRQSAIPQAFHRSKESGNSRPLRYLPKEGYSDSCNNSRFTQ